MCLLQKRERLRTHAQPNKHGILRVLQSLILFSVIYYQPFILPDSFNPINKPDQTKATCHNNHVPVNVQTRLRPQYCFAWSASVFPAKTPENNHHVHCLKSHSNNFGVLNLPLHRHTWLSPSHNTVRLQETAREEQELTFLPEKA